MRQLIARIDDRLHRRLKARAKAEGRSMNALVTDLLSKALGEGGEREQFEARLKASGLWYIPPRPKGRVPPRDELIESLRGKTGSAVSDALEDDRSHSLNRLFGRPLRRR